MARILPADQRVPSFSFPPQGAVRDQGQGIPAGARLSALDQRCVRNHAMADRQTCENMGIKELAVATLESPGLYRDKCTCH